MDTNKEIFKSDLNSMEIISLAPKEYVNEVFLNISFYL